MSIARLLGCLMLLVIVAAVARGINLWSWHATVDTVKIGPDTLDLFLNLPPQHRVNRFVAVSRDLGSQRVTDVFTQWTAAWLITDGDVVTGGTAIVRDSAGNLAAIDLVGVLPTSSQQAMQTLTPQWLAAWDVSEHDTQPLDFRHLTIGVWDPDALVYVTGGPDNQPGLAGIDDDQNGIIDDLSELGTTLSDDQIVSPDHPDYQDAADAKVVARIIDRGTVVNVAASTAIDLATHASQSHVPPADEIWLSFSHASTAPARQICLRLK